MTTCYRYPDRPPAGYLILESEDILRDIEKSCDS